MEYGLYLYKNLPNNIKLEIHRKNWTGKNIEIKALSGETPLELIGLDNSGYSLATPIIKSSVNINIIDLGEIKYEEFFTADATKFKVIIKENDTQIWGGYITPDSFSQTYAYRTTITLIARDNLGLLDSIDFDWFEVDFVSVDDLLSKARSLINWAMHSSFIWLNQQYISESYYEINNSYINTKLFAGKTWWVAIEETLRSLGQQLRYIGYNSYGICNVADLYDLNKGGEIIDLTHSINDAAQIEIIPSLKTIEINQTYGILATKFRIPYEYIYYQEYRDNDGNYYRYHRIRDRHWINSTNVTPVLSINPEQTIMDHDSWLTGKSGEYVFISGRNASFNPYIYYPVIVSKNIQPCKITINVQKYLYLTTSEFMVLQAVQRQGEYTWFMRIRICIVTDNNEIYGLYHDGWRLINNIEDAQLIELGIAVPGYDATDVDYNDTEVSKSDVNINLTSIPYDGELRFCVYPIKTGLGSDGYLARLNTVNMTPVADNINGGITLNGSINENGNVKESIALSVCEIPIKEGDSLVYAGGLFDSSKYHKALTGWHRRDNKGGVKKLSELVGRGYAHHYASFTSVNGEPTGGKFITLTPKFKPSYFGSKFRINGDVFIPNYASFNVGTGLASLELRQVSPYYHLGGDYTNSISTGSSETVVSGGGNTIMSWGNSASSESKRIYELNTTEETESYYTIADKRGSDEAVKIPVNRRHASTHFMGGSDQIKPHDIDAAKRVHRHIIADVDKLQEELDKRHPKCGTKDLDFIARDLTAKKVTAQNVTTETLSAQDGDVKRLTSKEAHIERVVSPEVVTPEFLDDMLVGHGFTLRQIKDGPNKGLTELWVDKGFFRHGIETLKLAYNQIEVTGGEMWVTEGGVISGVEVMYERFLVTEDGSGITTQGTDMGPQAEQGQRLMAGNEEQFERPIVRFTVENPGAKDGALGENSNPFRVGDIVMAVVDYEPKEQQGSQDGSVMVGNRCFTLITQAMGGNEYIGVAYDKDSVPVVGMTLARWGNVQDVDRQGAVHLSGKSKRIMITDGVDSTVIRESNVKVILGKLEGMTHSVFGKLKGYGALMMNGYFSGTFILRNGKSVEEHVGASFEVLENRISSKVEKDGVISSINQTSEEVSIDASRINLNGAVTANGNAGFKGDGTLWGKEADISGKVTATSGRVGPLKITTSDLEAGCVQISETGSTSAEYERVDQARGAETGPWILTKAGGTNPWSVTPAIRIGQVEFGDLYFFLDSSLYQDSGTRLATVEITFKAVSSSGVAIKAYPVYRGKVSDLFTRKHALAKFPAGAYLTIAVRGIDITLVERVSISLGAKMSSGWPEVTYQRFYFRPGSAVILDNAGFRAGFGGTVLYVGDNIIALINYKDEGVIRINIGGVELRLDKTKLTKLINLLS